jgi:hypothetical protein
MRRVAESIRCVYERARIQTRGEREKISMRQSDKPETETALPVPKYVTQALSLAGLLVTALVGLLTPELRAAWPSRRGCDTATMAKMRRLNSFGYSGGAVPELNRSSLFAGRFSRNDRPPMHVRTEE